MNSIEHLAPGGRFTTPPLSAATRFGSLLFVSGTPGYHDDGRIDEGDFGAQFEQAMVVLREVLARGGSSVRSLLKVNVLLTRASDVAEMNRRYAAALGPGPYPARTTSVVLALPDPRMLLEIECVAAVEDAAGGRTAMSTFQIGMVIFPGMTSLDFAGPLDVFARLPDTQVHVLAKDLQPVVTDIGFCELPSLRMADAPALDLLFIGGGPGVNALMEDAETLAFFADRAPQAHWVTSVCTGALVLGAAGLLRGYRAATHWAAMEVLRHFEAIPVAQRVVVDRNRITGGGVTAGIDFALTVAAELHGAGLAQGMQLAMEYAPQPPFDTGSPATAPAALVAAMRERLSGSTAARMAAAQRVAARNGWTATPPAAG